MKKNNIIFGMCIYYITIITVSIIAIESVNAGTAVVGTHHKQINGILEFADDIVAVDFSNVSTIGISNGGGGSAYSVAFLNHSAAVGGAGGTPIASAWTTRTLNVKTYDPDGFVNLSTNNEFILGSGSYCYRATGPCQFCNVHQMRLWNVTDGTYAMSNVVQDGGPTAFSIVTQTEHDFAEDIGCFTITSNKAYRIEHWASNSAGAEGFGRALALGALGGNKFTFIEIWKEP